MTTLAPVTDTQKRVWQYAKQLGKSSWATTWLVQADDGEMAVLKVPHRPSDLGGGMAGKRKAGLCAARAQELAELLREGPQWAVELLDLPRIEGQPALLFRYYPSSLHLKLLENAPLNEVIRICSDVAGTLHGLKEPHGCLHPRNVLLDAQGNPLLDSPFTPAAAKINWGEPSSSYQPGEAGDTPSFIHDTWALCAALFQASMGSPRARAATSPTVLLEVPKTGLDKVTLASLRDRLLARLEMERSNPRFRSRLADRLSSLLNRALSAQASPSPPYRFEDPSELATRLDRVAALVDPHVEDIGRLLLGSASRDMVFQGDQAIGFAVTIGCSGGVESPEDIACGFALRDLDASAEERISVPESTYEVRRHPSGRLRFGFTLPSLAPGRYSLRVAFSIRDGSHAPSEVQGHFEVRPPPGWVPPQSEATPTPLPMRTRPEGASLPVKEPDEFLEDAGPRVIAFDPSPEDMMPTEAMGPQPVAPPSDADLDSDFPVPQPEDAVPTVSVFDPQSSASHAPVSAPPSPPATPVAQAPSFEGVAPAGSSSRWDMGPGQWQELDPQGLDGGPPSSFDIPAQDDLGSWDSPQNSEYLLRFNRWKEAGFRLLQRDLYTSVVASIGASLILLVAAATLLKACG